MIDIHTHILPGIDDGTHSIDEALKLIKLEIENGVKEVIATPHLYKGSLSSDIIKLSQSYSELMEQVTKQNLDIKIHTGHEIYYHSNIIELLNKKEFLTLADSNYILLELDSNELDDLPGMLYEIKLLGYIPILAHIERYKKIYQNKMLLQNIINEGVHLQINADSIFANHKSSEYMFAKYLLDNNLISFIASDCHNTTSRRTDMLKCYNKVYSAYGKKYAKEIFYKNPRHIINNTVLEYKFINAKKKSFISCIFN